MIRLSDQELLDNWNAGIASCDWFQHGGQWFHPSAIGLGEHASLGG